MKRILSALAVATTVVLSTGCMVAPTVTLAPGADQVHITKIAADVVNCKPVGSVDGHLFPLNPPQEMLQMQNETLGLGGDTLFVTFDPADHAVTPANSTATGVAYRCKKA